MVADTLNPNTGISDFYSFVAFNAKKGMFQSWGVDVFSTETFKNFDDTSFKHDIEITH